MGWGRCGKNEKTGKMMGYAYVGTCAFRGCKEKIDHGLAYVCGGMHEGGELGCGKYMCPSHMTHHEDTGGRCVLLCPTCAASLDVPLTTEGHEAAGGGDANV